MLSVALLLSAHLIVLIPLASAVGPYKNEWPQDAVHGVMVEWPAERELTRQTLCVGEFDWSEWSSAVQGMLNTTTTTAFSSSRCEREAWLGVFLILHRIDLNVPQPTGVATLRPPSLQIESVQRGKSKQQDGVHQPHASKVTEKRRCEVDRKTAILIAVLGARRKLDELTGARYISTLKVDPFHHKAWAKMEEVASGKAVDSLNPQGEWVGALALLKRWGIPWLIHGVDEGSIPRKLVHVLENNEKIGGFSARRIYEAAGFSIVESSSSDPLPIQGSGHTAGEARNKAELVVNEGTVPGIAHIPQILSLNPEASLPPNLIVKQLLEHAERAEAFSMLERKFRGRKSWESRNARVFGVYFANRDYADEQHHTPPLLAVHIELVPVKRAGGIVWAETMAVVVRYAEESGSNYDSNIVGHLIDAYVRVWALLKLRMPAVEELLVLVPIEDACTLMSLHGKSYRVAGGVKADELEPILAGVPLDSNSTTPTAGEDELFSGALTAAAGPTLQLTQYAWATAVKETGIDAAGLKTRLFEEKHFGDNLLSRMLLDVGELASFYLLAKKLHQEQPTSITHSQSTNATGGGNIGMTSNFVPAFEEVEIHA